MLPRQAPNASTVPALLQDMSRSPTFAAVDAEQATSSRCNGVSCTSITPPIQDEKILDALVPTLEEGGHAGWLTVFGSFWALFATFGQVNSFGSYQAYYVKHQLSAYTSSDVSWIGSVQLWVFFFSVRMLCFPRITQILISNDNRAHSSVVSSMPTGQSY
jgi:hypothetical protein